VDVGGWYGVHRQEGNIIADKKLRGKGIFFDDWERVGGLQTVVLIEINWAVGKGGGEEQRSEGWGMRCNQKKRYSLYPKTR